MITRISIDEELTEQIEEARGGTDFSEWIHEACRERLMTQRVVGNAIGDGALRELYIAVVEEGWGEAILLWRCHWPEVGDTMLPVVARDEEGMAAWTELIALEVNMMDGPPVRWRRWEDETEELGWLRAPAVEDPD